MSPTRADGLRPGPSATLPRFAAAKAACRRACPCVRHPGQALPSSARATSFSTAVALSTRQQESLYCTLGPGVTWVTFKCSVTALRHVCGVRQSSSHVVPLRGRVPACDESLRTSHSCMSPARELMLSTAVGRDCGSSGCQSSGWTIPARLGAVWVTAWPHTAGGIRVVVLNIHVSPSHTTSQRAQQENS